MKRAINKHGGDLCKDICDLQELLLSEVDKLCEKLQCKLSILTQRVEDVHADWALCKHAIVSGVGGSKIYVKKLTSQNHRYLWGKEKPWRLMTFYGKYRIYLKE